jgi:hypothetical protein
MKNLLVFFFACLIIFPGYSQMEKQNSLKFNPLHFIDHTFLISYERLSSDLRRSFEINAGITAGQNWRQTKEGFVIEPQYKHYIINRSSINEQSVISLLGVYFSPFIHYKYLTVVNYNIRLTSSVPEIINTFGAGTVIGFKLEFMNSLTIEPYIGGGAKISKIKPERQALYSTDIWEIDYSGIYPKTGMKLGIRF